MKIKSVKTQAWQLILLPAISIILLLASTVTYLYISRLNDFVVDRGLTLANKVAHLSQIALLTQNEELLSAIIDTSREEPYIRAIQLFDNRTDKLYFGGPKFLPLTNENTQAQDPYTRLIRTTAGSKRFTSPIMDSTGNAAIGWVEIELIVAPYQRLIYKNLLIVVLATIACLLLAGYLAIRLHQHIIRPIDQIKYVMRKFTEGKLSIRADNNFSLEFSLLANALNAMGASLEKTHGNLLLSISQSTEELQETLDTIEIQSIELDIARKNALEASRIKSEFLANTSHEIRTPLNGIIGFTNLTLKTSLDEQQRTYVQTIHDSAQNLLTSINDILDFSKIESGQLILDYISLPLRKTIEESVNTSALDAREKNIQILTLIDPAIPLQLMGDPTRFKQAIYNLLSNAIKFSQAGTILIKADLLNINQGQAMIKISIKDEGIGLTPDQQKQLFSSFSQLDTSKSRKHGGTGLGLAICKGLANRMHGEIGIESEVSVGSTFWFTARLGIDTNHTEKENTKFKKERILVCSEDELSYLSLKGIVNIWQAKSTWITTIHNIFSTLRESYAGGVLYSLLIINISPEENKLPPALLSNISDQLESEFSCKLIIVCTPFHYNLFKNHAKNRNLNFLQQPVTQESMHHCLTHAFSRTAQNLESEEPSNTAAKILVVDDNPANLQLTQEFLRSMNTEVTLAENGADAIQCFKQSSFDLILMDIQMPIMDGIETTQKIRALEDHYRTPIVALTAHSIDEQKTDFLIAGLDDCIRKPVNEAQLMHTLKRWTNINGGAFNNKLRISHKTEKYKHEKNWPVNIAQCVRLTNNKPDLACDMLTMLLKDLAEDKKLLNISYDQQDYSSLSEQAHKLYGSCCYCGVPHLHAATALLDRILQSKNLDHLPSAFTSLNRAIERLLAWSKNQNIKLLFHQGD